MSFGITVTLLLCIAAFCVGLSVRSLWSTRPADADSARVAPNQDDEPYPLWFE